MDRRLITILAADVVDYTRLMGADEARMLAGLAELREALFEPVIAAHRGDVVKRMGDGWLVSFANVSDAVACAVDVQERLRGHEVIRLRIGVHVGDVSFGRDDIYGDGINIAARLEALAAPGEVLISDMVHHSLDGQAAARFSGGEATELKNVARPVQVWRWSNGEVSASGQAPPASGKPSIAVLPFANMSGEADQEFFADGMAEDIITELSRYRALMVIARNSTFAYKGQSPDLRDVARDLGVKYVLEGSIRKSGARVRVTAQLIDGKTGAHLWAERYDRSLDDIFALQDEITLAIVTAIGPEIDQLEREQAARLPPESLDAWACYQRGLWHLYRFNREDNAEAQRLFRTAITQSPRFAPAHAALAHALYYVFVHDYAEDQAAVVEEGFAVAQQAVAMDARDADAHFALGRMHYVKRDFPASITSFQTAIRYNASFSHSHLGLGTVLCYACDFEAAIESCDRALLLSPNDPARWVMSLMKAVSFYCLDRLDEAGAAIREAVQHPGAAVTAHATHAVIAAQLGNADEAARARQNALRLKPDFDLAYYWRVLPFADDAARTAVLDGLRKAELIRDADQERS